MTDRVLGWLESDRALTAAVAWGLVAAGLLAVAAILCVVAAVVLLSTIV